MRKIITIGREYGAGGGEIGKKVAKELGIAYYDRDIILKTAMASHNLDPERVRMWDERVPKNFGFAQSLFNGKAFEEELWEAQKSAIRTLAEHESCVIVGRNGNYILKEFGHSLHVFAHADSEWRLKRMMEMLGQTREQVKETMKNADKTRKHYCEYYTGKNYGDARDYDLTIDTGKLGIDRAVSMILELAKDL